MKTSNIWRNCLIRELNIPFEWKNDDGQRCDPPRQDLFLVTLSKTEVETYVFDLVGDMHHITKITASLAGALRDFSYLMTRNLSYVQYYPYLNLNTTGSLWESFGDTFFGNPTLLKDICINQ